MQCSCNSQGNDSRPHGARLRVTWQAIARELGVVLLIATYQVLVASYVGDTFAARAHGDRSDYAQRYDIVIAKWGAVIIGLPSAVMVFYIVRVVGEWSIRMSLAPVLVAVPIMSLVGAYLWCI